MSERKVQALKSALKWLESNHQVILSPRPTWIKGLKRIAEICTLVQFLQEGKLGRFDPMFEEHIREWLHGTWRALRQGEFFADVVQLDPLWISLALNYTTYFRNGLRNSRFETLLAQHAHQPPGASWFVELAVACGMSVIGLESNRDIDDLARNSWSFRLSEYQRPDPPRAYETTHVIMWLRDVNRVPPAIAQRILDWNPQWMASYQVAHNPDVHAELIMMNHHLGRCVTADVWDWQLAKQDPDGSFPAMDIPSRVLGRYHATVVGAIALACCLGTCH